MRPLRDAPLDPRSGWLATAGLALSLAIAVTAAHWPVLGSRALALDDDLFVTHNPLVQRPSWSSAGRFFGEVARPSTVNAYYLPLSMTSLMLDWAAGGRPDHLRPFHVTSLALHVAATVLLFLVLGRLLGHQVPAALAALLYGVHPLMVEAIASAGERKTVLATALGLASLYAHVRFAQTRAQPWRAASIAAFALALLSKPSVLTLPLAMLGLDAWPLRRLSRQTVLEKWPHALLALAAAVIAIVSVRNTWEFGAPPPLEPLRVLTQVVWLQGFYLGKVIWPAPLATAYDAPPVDALSRPDVALPVAAAIVAGALLWALRRRAPGLAVGGIVFFVLLVPTFAILRYSNVIAYDRYLHLPAAGLAIALGACVASAWERMPRGWSAPRAALVLGLLGLAAAASFATRVALLPWRDTMALWQHTVKVSPGVPDSWNGLGVTYSDRQESAKAIEAFRRGIAVDSSYGSVHYNLGRELALLGRVEEAIPHLELAVVQAPGSTKNLMQLGAAYQEAHRLADAEACYRRALAVRPDFVPAMIRLGFVESEQGRTESGAAHLRRALALSPGDPLASLALAQVLGRSGADAEVVGLLRQAMTARPDWIDPMNEMAWVLATAPESTLRDPAQAVRLAERAVALSGRNDASLLDTKAAALAAAGRFAEARAAAESALAIAREQRFDSLGRDIERRLQGYRLGRAFVQVPVTEP